MLGVLIVGILLGSATTSVVWASHQFSDVPTSHIFHGHITWAADNGIATGYSDGKFRPNDPVSRGASVAFLHRYNNALTIVHHAGTITAATQHTNTVDCPSGKRPLSGGGSTNQVNLMLTDIVISATAVTVRWESDDNVSLTGSSDAWALCAPA
jgi:hypothetical protein